MIWGWDSVLFVMASCEDRESTKEEQEKKNLELGPCRKLMHPINCSPGKAKLALISMSRRLTIYSSWLPVSLSCMNLITLFSSLQGNYRPPFWSPCCALAQKAA